MLQSAGGAPSGRPVARETANATMPTVRDALDRPIRLDSPPDRIVSLVPSLTETVAIWDRAARLVGVTKFCLEPPQVVAGLRKIGGTKDPDVDAIVRLAPDLVLANQEENRREDVEALIAAGLTVLVGHPRTVAAVADELETLATLLGPNARAAQSIAAVREAIERQVGLNQTRPRVRVFCPIWRHPYMAVGGDTYAGDVLRLAGGENVFERHRTGTRYPQVSVAEIEAADPELILLPDEPFHFRERHRQEFLALRAISAARGGRVALVDGRLLTWFGPRSAEAADKIAALLDGARPDWTPPDDAAAAEETEPAVSPVPVPAQPRPPAPKPKRKPVRARPRGNGGAELPPGLRLNVEAPDVVDDGG